MKKNEIEKTLEEIRQLISENKADSSDLKGKAWMDLRKLLDQVQTHLRPVIEVNQIVDQLGIGIWKWDLTSNQLEWDSNMYKLYGCDPKDFSGAYDAWENALSEESKGKAIEEINVAVDGGRDFNTTFQVIHKNTGRVQEIRARAFIIRDENKKPIKMWGLNLDRTREAELEADLRRTAELLDKTSTLAKIGGWELDLSTGEVHMSDQVRLIHEIDSTLMPLQYSNASDWYPAEALPKLQAAVNKAVEHGEPYDLELPFITAKKKQKWVRTQGNPVYKNGKITGLFGTLQDINDRKALELKSLQQTLWLEAILGGTSYAIIATKSDGTISTFNKAAEQMLGYTFDEIKGKTPQIFHDFQEVSNRAKVLTQELKRPIAPGFDVFTAKAMAIGPDTNDWTYIRKDGSRLKVRLCVTAIFGENKTHVGFLGIAQDMTHELELQNTIETERTKASLNAKFASLGEMSAGIAHEINNPLAIISGNISILTKFKDDPEKFSSKIQAIQKSCDRISKIVSGLKKFSRSGDKPEYKKHSLSRIAEEAKTLTEAKSKKQNTPVTIENKAISAINCDDVEIEQVLINLIQNGIDAASAYPEKWVKISIFETEKFVVLRVTDSGPGIPENIKSNLFQPFFTTKKIGEGTGLGLSVSKGILDQHQATIEILNDIPHTCFEIKFPKINPDKDIIANQE